MKNNAVILGTIMLATALPVLLSLSLNQGSFIYTLDDPYIHLALAENIFHGHYGINADENTAPSSSVIWPFLLVPFAWAAWSQMIPLMLNLSFALATGLLLARFFKWENLPMALASIFAFNLAGLVLTGMEHSLQLLLVTAAAVLLTEYSRGGELSRWTFPILALAPLVRYECMSVTLPAFIFLYLSGEKRRSLLWLSVCLAALGIFSLYLVSLGLDPLPASVLAKSSVVSGSGGLFGNMLGSLGSFRGMAQAVMLVPLLAGALCAKGRMRLLALTGVLSVLLHLFAGRFGWFHRYGVYIWAWSVMLSFTLHRKWIGRFRIPVLLSFLALSASYLSGYTNIAIASSNIYRQQYQMRRFIHQRLQEPIAVNDLGLVCMGYDRYVLDLWGLATPGAITGALDPLWIDSAAAASGVELAVVYANEIPGISHWRPLARLELDPPLVVCVSGGVDFLCAPWADPERFRQMLEDFAEDLPPGVDLYLYGFSN